ncbi:MAG: hypothetical protein WC623_22495 [Pedobacter sp.]|uniref:hypothetical protein n=1 Tax=Pedobacter sp. TaxID=1411316 RepID=UPI00356440D8
MNKSNCRGYYQDRYNHPGMCERPGIDAPVTSKECWHLKNAKMVWRKRVSISQVPPRDQKATRVPDCYSETGYVFVDAKRRY